MIEKKIYTSVDPESYLIGTYGYFADAPERLEDECKSEPVGNLKKLVEIRPRCEPFRYRRGTPLGTSYALYLPACIEKNKAAYIAWMHGKQVSAIKNNVRYTYTKGGVTEPDFLNSEVMIAEEEKLVEREYVPFKTIDEFIEASGQRRDSTRRSESYDEVDNIIARAESNKGKGRRPFIWLRLMDTGVDKLVTGYSSHTNCVIIDGGTYDMVDLFRNWTFLDGSPCGKERT